MNGSACRPLRTVPFLNEPSKHPGPAGEGGPSLLPRSQQGLVSRSHLETLAQLGGLAKGRGQNAGPVAVNGTLWPCGILQWRTRGGPGSDTVLLDRRPCCLPWVGLSLTAAPSPELALSEGRGGSSFLPREQASPF